MPFTPFHFGPGLLLKSLSPRHFSFTAFVATQVVIDCETLYYLAQNAYPVHRTLHTLVGATAAGLGTSALLIGGKRIANRLAHTGSRKAYDPIVVAETSTNGILTGGVLGGLSHSVLDSIMHRDVRPFGPWSSDNPFLDVIGLGTLHTLCVLSGLIGLLVMGRMLSEARGRAR